jgi:hypothetical protein
MGSFQPGLLNLANWMGNVMLPIGAGLILACGIYQFSKGQELERYVLGAMAALLGSGLLRLAEVISQQNDGADQFRRDLRDYKCGTCKCQESNPRIE